MATRTACSSPGVELDRCHPAHCRRPLADSEQAHVLPPVRRRRPHGVEADAVVIHLEPQILAARESDAHLAGVGMVQDVADRLLGDTEHGRLDRRRQSRQIGVRLDGNIDPHRLKPVRRIPANSRRQPQIIKHQGP